MLGGQTMLPVVTRLTQTRAESARKQTAGHPAVVDRFQNWMDQGRAPVASEREGFHG